MGSLRVPLRVAASLAAAVLFAAPAPMPARAITYVYVQINLSGNGSGTWKTTDSNGVPDNKIDCEMVNGVVDDREVCIWQYVDEDGDGIMVIYFAILPAAGSCWGTVDCSTVPHFGPRVVLEEWQATATFQKLQYSLTISTDGGTGSGVITGDPGNQICNLSCTLAVYYGVPVDLMATANAGSYFGSWSGNCAGQGAHCQFTITGNANTTANFILGSPPTPHASSPPVPKPSASAKATAPPGPGATLRPGSTATAAPGSSPQASIDPNATVGPSTDASAGASDTAPSASESPGGVPLPTGAPSGTAGAAMDPLPIVLAILVVGVLIAIVIGYVGYGLRKSRGSDV